MFETKLRWFDVSEKLPEEDHEGLLLADKNGLLFENNGFYDTDEKEFFLSVGYLPVADGVKYWAALPKKIQVQA